MYCITTQINFSGLLRLSNRKNIEKVDTLQSLKTTQPRLQHLKAFPKNTYDACCETELYTPKFHLIDHLIKDLDRFWMFGTV